MSEVTTIYCPSDKELRTYQRAGVMHLLSGQRKMLFDDMGLGKTAQAIVAVNSKKVRRILVFCPPAVRYNWELEFYNWSVFDYKVQVLVGLMDRIDDRANVVICSYSLVQSPMIQDQLKDFLPSATIIDEIHWLKNSKAKRTKICMNVATKSPIVYGLTGTPMTVAPIDLFPIVNKLGIEYFTKIEREWFNYTKRYCARYKGKFGWVVDGACNLRELKDRLFKSGFCMRRLKTDVLDDLPEKTYNLIPLNCKREINSVVDPFTVDYETVKGLPAGELAQLRKEVGIAKVDYAIEHIKDRLLEYDKLIVFAWHKEVVTRLSEEFSDCSVTYDGSTTAYHKAANLKSFTNDPSCKVFIANITSAGTGLNGLQKIASSAVFVEPPWNASDLHQASDRLHRMGQRLNVLIDVLVLRSTIDERVMSAILKKDRQFNRVFGS